MAPQYRAWNAAYKVAPLAYERFARAQDHRPLLEEIQKVAGIEGRSCLDVGTGTGKYAFLLKDNGAATVVGVDRCKELIEIAQSKAAERPEAGVEFIETDAKDLKFKSRFDIELSAWAINGPWDGKMEQLDRVFDRMFGALKSNGRIFLVTTPPGEYGGELSVFMDAAHLAHHTETKAAFIGYLKEKWDFSEKKISVDWNFVNAEEAALCFALFYHPSLAEAILSMEKSAVKANATLMAAGK